MNKNLSFEIALIISILIHVLLLYFLPNIKAFQEQQLRVTEIEVTYEKLPEVQQKKFAALSEKIPLPRNIPDAKDIRLKDKKLSSPSLPRPQFKEVKIIPVKPPAFPDISLANKKVTLPEIEQPEIKHPLYLNYYQSVREKIRRYAYSNYAKLHEGEVYISFIIDSAGNLKDIKVLEDKSCDNPYLKQISIKSIQDASPYPAFPKDLDYPQLSFNVIISYEIE